MPLVGQAIRFINYMNMPIGFDDLPLAQHELTPHELGAYNSALSFLAREFERGEREPGSHLTESVESYQQD